MKEKAEKLKQFTGVFIWKHPINRCKILLLQPTIIQTITAIGSSRREAKRYARIEAENMPQICDSCGRDYKLS